MVNAKTHSRKLLPLQEQLKVIADTTECGRARKSHHQDGKSESELLIMLCNHIDLDASGLAGGQARGMSFGTVEDAVRFERVTFEAGYGGERMVAYLALPGGGEFSPPYQTVVVFPGSGLIHLRNPDGEPPRGLPDFLPRSGRAVVLPVFKASLAGHDS